MKTLNLQHGESRQIMLHDGRELNIDPAGIFEISNDIGNHKFDLSWVVPDNDWQESAKEVVLRLLETHSIDYARCCWNDFRLFSRDLIKRNEVVPVSLSVDDLVDYPLRRPISSWLFVNAVLTRIIAQDLPGLEKSVEDFLGQPEKWEQKGNGSYFALIANDPRRGALTEQELRSVYTALNSAYAERRIQTAQWALCYFLIATGLRPIQIARMRMKDVILTDGPEGNEYTLLVTIAKTREAIKKTRWKRKCPTQLAEVLANYLETPDIKIRAADEPLFFLQSVKVSSRLNAVFNELDTYSERLGGAIPLFPYRFRYTLGTRAIALGARDEEVARLLTHTSLHCVRYYRAALPSLQTPIAEALGDEMAIFAKAFKGRLIEDLAEATRSGDEGALISAYEHLHGDDIGACGTSARCYQDAPRSCLTCEKFEPFRGAPWPKLREVLLADRAAEKSDRIRLITEEQIAAVDQIMASGQTQIAAAK